MKHTTLVPVFVLLMIFGAPVLGTPLAAGLMPRDALARSNQAAIRRADEVAKHWEWVTEKWTGDDRPFARVRNKIDAIFASKANMSPIIAAFQGTALANPKNALDQFQWVYACYRQSGGRWSDKISFDDIQKLLYAMTEADQPHCYNYARLQFLLTPGYQQVAPLAKRLLKLTPNDIDVQFSSMMPLALSDNADSNAEALKIADNLFASHGNNVSFLFAHAVIYDVVGLGEKNIGYCRTSIKELRQCMSQMKASDPRIDRANMYINYMETWIKDHPWS
jgi:hypothetical protein